MGEPGRFDCLIIGAGIGGLAAAWELARAGRRVIVLESKPQVAGVIGSEVVDGFLLEQGPNSFTSFPPDIMELLDQVGLRERTIERPMREHDRFIWRDGGLRKVPGQALRFGEKVRAFAGLVKYVPPPKGDLTVGEYFRQRVGDAVVDNMLRPFLAGVYAADADRVSFEATLPKIFEMVHGQGILGVPVARRVVQMMSRARQDRKAGKKEIGKSLVSFPDGLREMPEAMARAIEERGGIVRAGVKPLLRREEGQWLVEMGDGVAEAPRVVLATEAWSAAELLAPHAPEAARILDDIPYAPLLVVHAGLRAEQLAEQRNGFGFLSVDGHGVRMLGMIWSEKIFDNRAPAGHRLLTCFYGGEKDPEAMTWDDEQLRAQFLADLKTTMRFAGGDFALLRFTRWERALPIFRVGHARVVEQLRAALPPGIELLGNYLGDVSVPNRVVAAKALAAKIME